jgi:hypothetical protein
MSGKQDSRRGFELLVERDPERSDGRFGVFVIETNGRAEHRRQVAHVGAERIDLAQPALLEALRSSGRARAALKATQTDPVALDEDAGVRIALALAVINGISKPGRTTKLLNGVSRLSSEESFYWYAHTLGSSDAAASRRRLKALRIFLAEE